MNNYSVYTEIKNRDAWSTLRGFVYQVDTTILRWLDLKDNEALELEKGEDIDIVTRDLEKNEISRELEQIKYRESNITLNHDISIGILLNFFIHRNNNSHKKIYFRFVTNTKYGIERPALFLDGKSGIEAWTELRTSNSINKDDERFIIIKSHLLKKIGENIIEDSKLTTAEEITLQNNWKDFIAHIENDDNLIQFIADFEWSFGNEDHNQISESIKKKLIDLEIITETSKAEILYSRLFLFVFKLLCNKRLKTIDKNDLEKQISLPELDSTDQNVLNLINNLLLYLDKRVTELEEKVSINSTQIATLINVVKLNNDSDTVFDFKLKNLSVKSPTLIKNGSLRKEKVSEIIQLFNKISWINFQGINGTGKSQLASLVCAEFQCYWWLDLRAYNKSIEKTTLIVEKFLSIISNSPILNNRNDWFKNVLNSIAKDTLIVLNDLPYIEKDSALSNLFIHLAESRKIKLLTTSNFKISQNVIQSIDGNIFHEYYDLNFTDNEIVEYLINNGANESIIKYASLISVISDRNPSLVSAIIYRLKLMNWGQNSNEVFEVLVKNEFTTDLLNDSQLLIKQTVSDENSRELLYRLSLIHWNFKHKELSAVSSVAEKILHPNEKLQDLLNIWIQEQEDSYQVSPLIYDIGEKNLQPEVIQNVHIAIAKSIISDKILDQISASRCITSFIKGKDYNNAGIILLNLYQHARNKEVINSLNDWGYLNYWSEFDIPKEMSVVLRAYIRYEQIRLHKTIGKSTTNFYNRLEEYTKEDSLSTSEGLLVHFLIISNFDTINLSSYWDHLDYIFKNWKQIDQPFKEVITAEMFSGLLWIPIQNIMSEKDINLWIKYIETLESEFNINFFQNEIAQDALTILSSKIVNSEGLKNECNFEHICSKLEILIEYFKYRKLELLEVVVIKEIVCLEFKNLKNQFKAEELTNATVSKVAMNNSKYLLYENLGKLYYNDKQIDKSTELLTKALELDCVNQLNYVETLMYGAASISSKDSKKAIKFCEKAVQLANVKEDYLELDFIQILGELAIAYWIDGDFPKSFETFENIVNRLLIIRDVQIDQYWIRLLMLCGHSLGYISPSVAREHTPKYVSTGSEYVKPFQGIFSFNTKDLSDLYEEHNLPIILTHLAIFSDGINNISKAYHWSQRAFDIARKNGNQRILIMISGLCSEYFLINFKIDEALESFLLFSAISSHLEGDNPEEKYKDIDKIKFSDILSKKPSKQWNAAENSTISRAIIPLLIKVLTSQLENSNQKIEYTEKFTNMLRNYISKASDKSLWELALELITRIIENKISEKELIERSNIFGEQERINLQSICILGFIFTTNDSNKQLTQILNLFPYLVKLFGSSKSIIKFILVPFVKNRSLTILKDSFVGQKEDYLKLVNRIESINISDDNAIQLILQQVVNELDINVLDSRKPWLYEYKEE